jgi:hypothetical protein
MAAIDYTRGGAMVPNAKRCRTENSAARTTMTGQILFRPAMLIAPAF